MQSRTGVVLSAQEYYWHTTFVLQSSSGILLSKEAGAEVGAWKKQLHAAVAKNIVGSEKTKKTDDPGAF